MTNEEKNIKQILGNEQHFRVPKGYFDTLADQIMAKIPEEEGIDFDGGLGFSDQRPVARKVSMLMSLPLRKLAASVAAVLLLGGGVTFGLRYIGGKGAFETHTRANQLAHVEKGARHTVTAKSDDAEFEQMADYAMMDNQDIYASLIAEN